MEYYVISTKKDNPFGMFHNIDFTICAKVSNENLAKKLQNYYNANDKTQICEIHPVMSDANVIDFLIKHNIKID